MALTPTTLRDFSGGWNVADSEYSLLSKFMTHADNIIVNRDNSIDVRAGIKLFADAGSDEFTQFDDASVSFATTNLSPVVTVTHTAHGLDSGGHVSYSGVSAFAGITDDQINRTHSILKVDADNYKIVVRSPATATGSSAQVVSYTADGNEIGGNIVDGRYFQDALVVVTDIGEVAIIDGDANVTRIWSYDIVEAQSTGVLPWRQLRRVSFAVYRSRMIIVNGIENDKPIVVDLNATNVCDYLVDPATVSNSAIPRADYVFAFGSYVLLLPSDNDLGYSIISISAKLTDSVYVDNIDPSDSIDVDLSTITQSVDPRITGVGTIRGRVMVTFFDSAMMGQIGLYDDDGAHKPDFTDTVAQHGCINSRTIVSLGNDILMTDFVGVPSISLSQFGGTFVPERVSEYIDPALQKNIARLDNDTLAYDMFAVFDTHNKRYMLFLPKYEETPISLPAGPIQMDATLGANATILLNVPGHSLEEGDLVTISGAAESLDLVAGDINGQRQIATVVDPDWLLIQLDTVYTRSGIELGGASITVTPVNDETIGYIYHTDKVSKIRRWTRFRGWNFQWGTVSKKGTVFFGSGTKIYQLGKPDDPVTADYVGDYDYREWQNSFAYSVNDRVKDGDKVWTSTTDHTSAASGDFAAYRTANPTVWEEYIGLPISWTVETPWSDFRNRAMTKSVKFSSFDTKGSSPFTYEMYCDSIYRNPETYQREPQVTMQFIGNDAGGFGQSSALFGGGRRTREQLLYETPIRGKLIKLRLHGQSVEPLNIVAISMLYMLEGPSR